jgi:plastocyanin
VSGKLSIPQNFLTDIGKEFDYKNYLKKDSIFYTMSFAHVEIIGDNKEEKGADLLRVGHTFDREGVYPVTVRVRSGSGDVAELGTIVRVTPPLSLPDLSFDGEPEVKGNKVKGEAPLHVTITPKTSIPLVQFGWDTQGTEGAKVTGTTVDATYRQPGTYTLILTGVDAENKSFRLPMSIEVTSPSPEPIILMKPENGEAPLRVLFDASQSFVPEGVKIAGFKYTSLNYNVNIFRIIFYEVGVLFLIHNQSHPASDLNNP